MRQYKTVSAPPDLFIPPQNPQAAFDVFANIMNYEAANGWIYHSMECITSVDPGAFGPISRHNFMLIFYREV